MKIPKSIFPRNEQGATAVIVAIILPVLVMFTALAVDVNHLYGVRNELQNAADAGALAGALVLFNSTDGTLDRPAALAEGGRIASTNRTGNQAVTEFIVETGHWSFTNQEFTASENTSQITWQDRPFSELDLDTDFINAVRVQANRSDTPSFFARILGFDQFMVSNDAVAYIGFTGPIYPYEVDLPIALCYEAITQAGVYNCNMGRMLNSGGNEATSMTAMWTNYSQAPCSTASSSEMQGLTQVCSSGNPVGIDPALGGIGTQNGVQDNVLGNIVDCWEAAADSDDDGIPDTTWRVTLPVVHCGVDNTCSPLAGSAQVDIVWIHYKNDPITHMNDIPTIMDDPTTAVNPDYSCPTTDTLEERYACWEDFVDTFNLENATGPPVTREEYEEMYQKKNIFFLPQCDVHIPAGATGGEHLGIQAKYPKLVE